MKLKKGTAQLNVKGSMTATFDPHLLNQMKTLVKILQTWAPSFSKSFPEQKMLIQQTIKTMIFFQTQKKLFSKLTA